ncbi:MAG: transaldolase [Elusimicrobiota bacterium]|nr:transaldolase [Elusimicrobiota bacterium]MDH5661497.1 transaldolase [Elusimicrobiota bacterium]
MGKNPVYKIKNFGQSIWYDNIERSILTSGKLEKMVEEDGVCGVTSNPTIFEKAITQSKEYDSEIEELTRKNKTPEEVYESLTIKDVTLAADILYKTYKGTERKDGYVSIEVPPKYAYDIDQTINEAQKLFMRIGRENIMIKVPATKEGAVAIERLIAKGINVNATLIFSLSHYENVARAYVKGLEGFSREGGDLKRVASVASLFVSRIDTLVDKEIASLMEAEKDPERKRDLQELMGKAAVANSKKVYQKFKEIFSQQKFKDLEKRGARVQRPLWASTSTKNPAYNDVKYVAELIGPDTINTIPQVTLDAFRDHGEPRLSLEENLGGVEEVLSRMKKAGIDLDEVCETLQRKGVDAFEKSFQNLLGTLKGKMKKERYET